MSQAGGEWCHCLRANPSAIFFVFSKRALPEQETENLWASSSRRDLQTTKANFP